MEGLMSPVFRFLDLLVWILAHDQERERRKRKREQKSSSCPIPCSLADDDDANCGDIKIYMQHLTK